MASTKCIDDLPHKMMLKIFSYVSIEDLVHSVQHVCTRWQEAFQDTRLWMDLVYRPKYTDSNDKIISVLKQSPKLQNLIIFHEVEELVLWTIANCCTQLKKLKFVFFQRLHIAYLKELVQKCPNIETFNMPDDVSYNIEKVEIIGQFINMVHLSLGERRYEYPVQLRPLADGCPALRSIDLNDKVYLSGDLEYILLKKRDQLHSLRVTLCTTDFMSTIPLLSVCTALKTLELLSYSDADVEASFQVLRSLETVTSLNLFSFQLPHVFSDISVSGNRPIYPLVKLQIKYNYGGNLSTGIVDTYPWLEAEYTSHFNKLTDEIVKNLHTLHQLQCVRLDYTRISDGGMDSIRQCRNLTQLSLNHCDGLTESSMQLIIELSGLQRLLLDNCDINGLPIRLIPSRLTHLTILSIIHCRNVDQEALAQLRADKPNLVVILRLLDP